MPFLPPNQQRQSTEGTDILTQSGQNCWPKASYNSDSWYHCITNKKILTVTNAVAADLQCSRTPGDYFPRWTTEWWSDFCGDSLPGHTVLDQRSHCLQHSACVKHINNTASYQHAALKICKALKHMLMSNYFNHLNNRQRENFIGKQS